MDLKTFIILVHAGVHAGAAQLLSKLSSFHAGAAQLLSKLVQCICESSPTLQITVVSIC